MSREEITRSAAVLGRAKEHSDCTEFSKESLKCLEKHPDDREVCAKYFERYKQCKGEQLERRKQARFEASGGKGHYSDPPWKHWENPFKISKDD